MVAILILPNKILIETILNLICCHVRGLYNLLKPMSLVIFGGLFMRRVIVTHIRDKVVSLARLDRLYCFKHQTNVFRNCCITPVSSSDHCIVQCSLFLRSVQPRSAYWHFNNALLSDNVFKRFRFFWKDFRNTKLTFSSSQQWCDYGKAQIEQFS